MRPIMTIICLAIMIVATCCKNEGYEDIKLVTPEEMQTLVDSKDVQLVDVRTPEEYKEGRILEAQNIDFNSPTFDEDISKLDKSKPVILFANAGGRSANVEKNFWMLAL